MQTERRRRTFSRKLQTKVFAEAEYREVMVEAGVPALTVERLWRGLSAEKLTKQQLDALEQMFLTLNIRRKARAAEGSDK